jgi:hypothetical protein
MISDKFKGGIISLVSVLLFIFSIGLLSRYLSSIRESYKRKQQYFDDAFMTDTYRFISRI